MTAVLAGLLVLGTVDLSHGQTAPTDPAVSRAQQRVEQAAAAYRSAERRSQSAEQRVKRASRLAVDTVLERLAAEDRLRAAILAADAAIRVRFRIEQRLELEQADLVEQLTAAYRRGGPAVTGAMVLRIVEEAADPNEFARTMRAFSDLLGHQSQVVTETRRQLTLARQVESEAIQARSSASAALNLALAFVAQAEAEVDGLRRAANNAEGQLIDRMAALVAAEQTLARAERDELAVMSRSPLWSSSLILPDGHERPAPSSLAAPADEAAPPAADSAIDPRDVTTFEQRDGWLANRRAALRGARSLKAELMAVRDDWLCPVVGSEFIDDFHFPRSHGRRHKGLDLFATRGTPIRMPRPGVVSDVDRIDRFAGGERDLGGITVTVTSGDESWYFAHLDRIPDWIRVGLELEPGRIVGYVGDTGNARGTHPHLHLGFSVGGIPVNPYPSVAVACERPAGERVRFGRLAFR